MFKKFLSLAALTIIGTVAYAQEPIPDNTVFNGQNGGKTVLVRALNAAYTQFLSGDSCYLSGIYGGELGFVYNINRDSVAIFPDFTVPGFVSFDHYAGQNDPGGICHGFVHYNGKNHALEQVLFSGKDAWDDVYITAYQGNGEKVVAMVYNEYIKPNGDTIHMNVAAVYDGKTGGLLKKLDLAWPLDPNPTDPGYGQGYGARGDCISGDGTVIGGHSTNTKLDRGGHRWSLAFWDIQDLNDVRAFGIEDPGFDFGTFNGVSYDGSILVGGSEANSMGVILYYDRENRSFTYDTIKPLLGWDFVELTAVSDEGMAIGYCGMAMDPITRCAIVYTKTTGLVKMSEFLLEYYDIDIKKTELHTPMAMSRHGSIWGGLFYDENADNTAWYTRLGTERIIPRPRNIAARAARGEFKTSITWQAPLISEYKLSGYNIYRDNSTTPLNKQLLATNVMNYEDTTITEGGRYTYYIEAVYENGVISDKRAGNQVLVVSPNDCLPVQTIGHLLDYNRYVSLYWGVPSSEVAALAANDIAPRSTSVKGKFNASAEDLQSTAAPAEMPQARTPKSYRNPSLDYIANVDMQTYSGYAAIKIGDYYYTSSHLGGGISVFDRNNNLIKRITPKGLGVVMSMVYFENENLLYCGTPTDTKILDLSKDTIKEVEDILPMPARFLAYVPELDGGKGGFVAGKEHSCHTYDMDGEMIDSDILDFKSIYACGAAYYKGSLYVSSATGTYMNEIYVYDFANRTQIGAPIQVVEDPGLYNLLSLDGQLPSLSNLPVSVTQAGGLSVCTLDDGTTALGAVFQSAYMTTRFVFLELESENSVAGYDLYRSLNGGTAEKINEKPLTSRRYKEELSEAGQYAYHVVVLPFLQGAQASGPSPSDTLTITKSASCANPKLEIAESNNWPILSWAPGATSNSLIGFNLIRDGQEVGRFWNENMRASYVDESVTSLGEYTYVLQSLYEDGCLGADSVTITLTGIGKEMAPHGLTLKAEKAAEEGQYNVTAEWETPLFEEPFSLLYGTGIPTTAINFQDYYEYWATVGWDQSNLTLYKDLYLVGFEYVIGKMPTMLEGIVVINDKVVYKQEVPRPEVMAWHSVLFDKSFPMNQPKDINVGYHTKYTETGVPVIDETFIKSGFSDVVSLDPNAERWSTLRSGGMNGSWCIAALVARKRDIDAATTANGNIDYSKLEGRIMRTREPLDAQISRLPLDAQIARVSAPKNGFTLQGFNIYRRLDSDPNSTEIKLNDELLKTFTFTDKVPQEEYSYIVGAVYSDGEEKVEQYINLFEVSVEDLDPALSLNLYPNPATEILNIDGTYETLQIFDLSGRLLRTHKAASQITLGGLKPGTYFFHFTDADAHRSVYKVVVR